ncbi:hypothetical protein Trydic_g3613 [Trypoxylus dichotomus]
MGRLTKTSTTSGKPNMKVHYRKLVDEYSSQCDSLKFSPSLPEYLSYCCHQCGHTQKLQVTTSKVIIEDGRMFNNIDTHDRIEIVDVAVYRNALAYRMYEQRKYQSRGACAKFVLPLYLQRGGMWRCGPHDDRYGYHVAR